MRSKHFVTALLCLYWSGCSDSHIDRQNRRNRATAPNQKSLDATADLTFKVQEDERLDLTALTADGFQLNRGPKFAQEPNLGELAFDEGAGQWFYQTLPNAVGEDRFTVQLYRSDKPNQTVEKTVKVVIQPVNDAPVIEDLTVKLPEDSEIQFDLPVFDLENDTLTYDIKSVSKGQAMLVDSETPRIRYRPLADQSGEATLTFTAHDGQASSEGTLTLQIMPVEDRIIVGDGLYQTNQDEVIEDRLPISNPDQDDIQVELVQAPQKGNLNLDPETGRFTYQPATQVSGQDQFSYKVWRGDEASNTGLATVTIQAVNQPPQAEEIRISCRVGETCQGQIQAYDPEGHSMSYHHSQGPEWGELISWDNSTGHFEYRMDHHQSSHHQDVIKYWVEDCWGERSHEQIIIIDIEPDHYNMIEDSFERDYVTQHDPGFHWRFLLDDNGKGIEENQQECKDHICAKIFSQHPYGFGPMGHEHRSLFFFGREGQSTHDLFLISKGFDLTSYRWVDIDFRYLIMDIGDNDSRSHDETEEYLKVEVCLYGEYECGLSPVDPHKLKSDRWITLFRNDPYLSQNGLNGRNHNAHDWQDAQVTVDLQHIEQQYPNCRRSNFVFRFKTRLQDGFRKNDYYKEIEDAVAIDHVRVKARSGHY
jgi:hypothetical protein